MKKTMMVLAAVFMAIPALAQAQNLPGDFKGVQNPAALKIAMNGDPDKFENFSDCVIKLKQSGTSDKDARKDCRDTNRDDNGTIKKVNNEGADASKNNWPTLIVSPYFGHGGLGTVGGDASLAYAAANGFCPGGRHPNGRCY